MCTEQKRRRKNPTRSVEKERKKRDAVKKNKSEKELEKRDAKRREKTREKVEEREREAEAAGIMQTTRLASSSCFARLSFYISSM